MSCFSLHLCETLLPIAHGMHHVGRPAASTPLTYIGKQQVKVLKGKTPLQQAETRKFDSVLESSWVASQEGKEHSYYTKACLDQRFDKFDEDVATPSAVTAVSKADALAHFPLCCALVCLALVMFLLPTLIRKLVETERGSQNRGHSRTIRLLFRSEHN